MTRRILLWSLGAGYWGAARKAGAAEETRSGKTVFVGDTRVNILVIEVPAKGRHSFIYFHPHEDEHMSAVVTRHTIRETGGRLVEIRSQGDRMISFHLKGAAYSFDPSRMFTEVGLQHSLFHYGPMSRAAYEVAANFRNAVLKQLGNGKTPIIAVENTTADGVTALSYRKGGALHEQAADLKLNPNEKPTDFFLVLDEGLFTRLHHAGFNTVLQSPDAPDDGSLSAFCQQNHWYYVKVETQERDMSQQQRMLNALPEAIG